MNQLKSSPSGVISPSQSLSGSPVNLANQGNSPISSNKFDDSIRVVGDHCLTTEFIFGCLQSDYERRNVFHIMAAENFSLRDVVKFGLICSGSAMDELAYENASLGSFRSWAQDIHFLFPEGLNMKTVVSRGLRLLASLKGPLGCPYRLGSLPLTMTAVPANSIYISQISIMSACASNARVLEISCRDLMDDDAESPIVLYPQMVDGKDSPIPQLDFFRTTPIDLRPLPEQLHISHHPYIDVIPWASFRSNVIAAISTDPPMIDEDDLSLDLMNDGSHCWGTTRGSLHGRGEGTPWDARSWEAKPWFLRKWEFLAGGSDSEVFRNSAWWHAQACEAV